MTITTGYNSLNGRVTAAAVSGFASLNYGYSNGRLTSIQRTAASKTQTYSLSYSTFGDLAAVAVGTQQLASYVHNVRTGAVETMTYGNGDTVTYLYNELDRLETVKYNGTVRFTYLYTGDGQLARVTDEALGRVYTYTYDSLGRLTYWEATKGGGLLFYTAYTYDDAGRVTRRTYGGSGLSSHSHTGSYSSGTGLLQSAVMPDGKQLTYSYDALERLTTVSDGLFSKHYNYAAPAAGDGTATTLLSNVNYKLNGTVAFSFSYTYDNMGRIASDGTYSYTYDKLGQLTTVKNSAGTTVASYTYDGAGNILTATENGTTVSYTYGNSNWADLLTAYNGQTITYDAIGNPTNYLGWTMTWENGRQLASASKGGASLSYTYDADGLRATKTVNGEEHTYIYNGCFEKELSNIVYFLTCISVT